MNPATLKTTAIVVGVVAALIALAAIIAVIIGRGDELNKTMKGIGNSTNDMISNVNQAPQRIGRNALGTNNWRGGLTWVGEEGPELVDLPSGSRVYNNKQSKQIVQQGEVLQNVYVTVQADDLQSAADVVRLFGEFRQVARQGV
jgi:hypothetical protein